MLLGQYADDLIIVKGVIPTLINERYPNSSHLVEVHLIWLKLGVSQHGDIGSNGSRGSLLQFRKLNTKIIVGHYHSPDVKMVLYRLEHQHI
jgi:hypothetical protein